MTGKHISAREIPETCLRGCLFPVAYELRALTGQLQVVIGGQAFVGQKFTGRRVVGAFKNGGGLVHIVEHGDIHHLRTGRFGGEELGPQKFTLQAWNGVEPLAGKVVPAETREHDG